ncbi:hypothetical protein [Azospirillum argentinense]
MSACNCLPCPASRQAAVVCPCLCRNSKNDRQSQETYKRMYKNAGRAGHWAPLSHHICGYS